jgi:hypothetical protein
MWLSLSVVASGAPLEGPAMRSWGPRADTELAQVLRSQQAALQSCLAGQAPPAVTLRVEPDGHVSRVSHGRDRPPRCLTQQLFAVKLSPMEDDRPTEFQLPLDGSGTLPPMDPMAWDWPTGLSVIAHNSSGLKLQGPVNAQQNRLRYCYLLEIHRRIREGLDLAELEEHRVDITAVLARDGTLHQGQIRGRLSERFDRCMDDLVKDFGGPTEGEAVGVTVYFFLGEPFASLY